MGSSRTMDEFGVILLSNFFHDAAKKKTKYCYGLKERKLQSNKLVLIFLSKLV